MNSDENLEALKEEREMLVLSIPDGGFPGSKAWKAARAAEKALEAFDVAHPEVLAAINAEHSAEMANRYQD